MKSDLALYRTIRKVSKTGAGLSPATGAIAGDRAANGAPRCTTTQSGQWSASVVAVCACVTWTNAIRATSARHRTAAVPRTRDLGLRILLESAPEAVKEPSPSRDYIIMDVNG